jgi:poly(3-hydroxybutyrate) depolymerase
MSALAGAGYTVAYLNGSSRRKVKRGTWNTVYCCACASKANENKAAHADAIIEDVDGCLAIGPARIFLLGHTSAAMLSYRIAGRMKTTPRAIAPVSGACELAPVT